MGSLTHDEAVTRSGAVDVDSYDVALDLRDAAGGGTTFRSETAIRFTAHAPETFVELRPAQLQAVVLDGVELDVGALAGDRFPLTDLGGDHELVVTALMSYAHDGEGLHRFTDPADGETYLVATSSVDNAPRWFACFDQPDLKARIGLDVTAPDGWTVLGNGPARAGASPGQWLLEPSPPISTYLATVVAGPWHSATAEHDGIPLGLHVRRSLAAELDRDAASLLQLTTDSLDAFHRLFGVRYPFGEYHQAFVPEFNWGAMENPGCVTFRDQMIFRSAPSQSELVGRASTVVHEMAHMWFGDLVTMRWWDDLWLNESFAEYLAHRVLSQIGDLPAWADFAAARKAWGYAADRRTSTHPVAGNGAASAAAALEDFDGISYAKGAGVLRQLAAYLGDDVFVSGLRRHIERHAWDNATFAELVGAWEDALAADPTAAIGADDLRLWTRAWLRTPGVDVVTVTAGDGSAVLERHDPLVGPASYRQHAFTVTVLPDAESDDVPRLDAVLLADEPVTVPAPEGRVLLPNAGDQTWATVRLDPAQWAGLVRALPHVPDPAVRVVAWNAVRTALEDGLVDLATVLDLAEAALPGEVDVVVARLLPWLAAAVSLYVSPGGARSAATDRLAGLAARLMHAAPIGSGDVVTAARAFAATTSDLDALRAWTAGRSGVAGLDVDVDLRWAGLERRAALGDLTPADVDDAAGADRTASGAVHAARCRALRPDPAAKAAAWAALLDPASMLSQYELTAVAEGIWVAGQEDLVGPYAARWFADMPGTEAFRSGYALRSVAGASFPALSVSAATLAAAEAFSVRDDVGSGLRRVASDRADDLRRALAVRTATAGGPLSRRP